MTRQEVVRILKDGGCIRQSPAITQGNQLFDVTGYMVHHQINERHILYLKQKNKIFLAGTLLNWKTEWHWKNISSIIRQKRQLAQLLLKQ